MIHKKKGRKLKRTASHRKATLANLCISLIKSKKIKTTLAKAKELRSFIEPLVTKSKRAASRKEDNPSYDIHMRRKASSFLRDKDAVKILFDDIAQKVHNRKGGYTRVLKIGRRFGDGAELAFIEFVDYNIEKGETKKPEAQETEKTAKQKPTKTAKSTKRQTRIPKSKTDEIAE